MKDQQARIAAAIAAYLEENTFLNDSDIYAPEITFGIVKEYPTPTHTECCKELADQIAAAIAPHLEAGAGWEDAPSWAEWRIFDENENIAYSLEFPSANTQMQVPKEFKTTMRVERRPK